eukprot:980892_1
MVKCYSLQTSHANVDTPKEVTIRCKNWLSNMRTKVYESCIYMLSVQSIYVSKHGSQANVGSDGISVTRFDKKQTWDEIEKCLQNELNKVAPQAQDNEPPKNEAATAVEDEKKELKEEDEADNVEEDKAKENETENVDAKKEQQQEQQDENVDKEQEQEKEKSEAILSTKEYVFKSIDKEQNKVTCLDADFNDISFDLDANNASLLEKIEKIVGQGNDEKKDVVITVSSLKDTQTVTDAKLNA